MAQGSTQRNPGPADQDGKLARSRGARHRNRSVHGREDLSNTVFQVWAGLHTSPLTATSYTQKSRPEILGVNGSSGSTTMKSRSRPFRPFSNGISRTRSTPRLAKTAINRARDRQNIGPCGSVERNSAATIASRREKWSKHPAC